MANLHRKALITPTKRDVVVVFCTPPDECDDLPPPAPPPPSQSVNHSLPPLIILMFCTLAVTLTLICYIAIMKTYRVCRNNRRRHGNTDETHEEFIDEDQRTMIHHPIWLINTIGLDQSVIDSIEVFKYKRGDGLIEGTDCSICLGEFQNDETLRLLPKCSHAFHVPCINTWLLSHKNCPLCRAPIVKDNSNAQIDPNSIESSTGEEIPNGVSEIETNQVEITQEIDSNDDGLDKKSLLSRVQSDLAPMRRSVSMDSFSASMVNFAVSSIGLVDQERRLSSRQLVMSKKQESIKRRGSCSSINIYSRVTKSSSFGRFSSKASGSRNRSY